MTLAEFSEIFALLAVQLRATDVDETTIRAYYRALQDIEPEFLMMAAHRLARTTDQNGQSWFPKTGEWRSAAQRSERDRADELTARLRKLPEPLCLACRDTGFMMDDTANRVTRCECHKTRRLEILGRRPMPALPAHEPEGDRTQEPRVVEMANRLAANKGF